MIFRLVMDGLCALHILVLAFGRLYNIYRNAYNALEDYRIAIFRHLNINTTYV